MGDFYLVQRLTRRDSALSGFDGMFGCQYMGSAEFEWGALPESLKRIRSIKRLAIHEGEVTRGKVTKTIYVVGGASTADVPTRLTEWMRDRYPRGKEATYFPEKVDNTADEYMRADAWWSLNEDVLWTLDKTTADDLLRAVKA